MFASTRKGNFRELTFNFTKKISCLNVSTLLEYYKFDFKVFLKNSDDLYFSFDF